MNYDIRNDYRVMNWQDATRNDLNHDGLVMSKDTYATKTLGFVYPNDGRMKDMRSIETVLDRPSTVGFDGAVSKTFNINNKAYKDGVYKNYTKMNNAQITYYIDDSIAQPFPNPIYSLSSYVDKSIFCDPMNSCYPQYFKTALTSSFNNMPVDQKTKDDIFWREDLTSRQQGGHLKSNFTARFVN